mgnify:FL=1
MMVALAVIFAVCYSAVMAGYYIQGAWSMGEASIIDKGLELGDALFENGTVVIRGVSTGPHQMVAFHLGTGNVSISLSGDSVFWSFPTNALIVRNLSLNRNVDAGIVSVAPAPPISMFEVNGSFMMRPQVCLSYEVDNGSIGGRPLHKISISSCYLSDFCASGRFDILKETSDIIRNQYRRECLYDCVVVVYIDAVEAASFQVRSGEQILVQSTHYNIRLEPMPRQ